LNSDNGKKGAKTSKKDKLNMKCVILHNLWTKLAKESIDQGELISKKSLGAKLKAAKASILQK